MKTIRVDLTKFNTRDEIHEYLKKECNFPSYYGCNLDALYDCLTDNPNFIFEIVDSDLHSEYIDALIETIEEANCLVTYIRKDL